MGADPAVLEFLHWLDNTADGNLLDFADRVETMPDDQVKWLRSAWPNLKDVDPPTIRPGTIRPHCAPTAANPLQVTAFAVSVMLFVDQAAVGAERFLVFGRSPDVLRHDFPHLIRMVADLRSLLEDGSLVVLPTLEPSRLMAEMHTLGRLWPQLDFDPTDDHYLLASRSPRLMPALANAFRCILSDLATPLATDVWTREMKDALYPHQFLDPRSGHASTLVNLAAPRFELPTRELVALRRDSGALADFRSSLARSLIDFAGLPDDPDVVTKTRLIVADRLAGDMAGVLREARRSAVIAAALGTARRIGFVGLGAASGAAMAAALSAPALGTAIGAASGSAVAIAESIREALGAKQRRDAGRAIGSVISAFQG